MYSTHPKDTPCVMWLTWCSVADMVSSVANMVRGVANMVCSAANTWHGEAEMVCGAATLADFTSFSAFLGAKKTFNLSIPKHKILSLSLVSSVKPQPI